MSGNPDYNVDVTATVNDPTVSADCNNCIHFDSASNELVFYPTPECAVICGIEPEISLINFSEQLFLIKFIDQFAGSVTLRENPDLSNVDDRVYE